MERIHGMWLQSDVYEPVKAGSIDGTDVDPHDKAIKRAMYAVDIKKYKYEKDSKIRGEPKKTLFVARLDMGTTEDTLKREFGRFGKIKSLRLVRDVVTGISRGYAFIEYSHEEDMREAFFRTHRMNIDGRQIMVDFERERVMKTWIPRRFGGGIGGKKESGQLRFGGRDRPFKKPYTVRQTGDNSRGLAIRMGLL